MEFSPAHPNKSIPKIIHYCWFGKTPLPSLAIKCIDSWKRFLPDYEIREWNESNFDVNMISYTKEAYEAKKFAFVSDFARFWILYHHGGIYFDTDVEVIRNMDHLIEKGPFMGCEKPYRPEASEKQLGIAPGLGLGVNPGLGLGVNPGLGLYEEIINKYRKLHFIHQDGSLNLKTVVEYTSEVLCLHGLKNTPDIQKVAGISIYPQEYFAPKDIDTKQLTITENTVSIHHYDASWAEWYDKAAGERGPILRKYLGTRIGNILNITIYIFQKYTPKEILQRIIQKCCNKK